jgi:chromosome partitioning protein
VRWGTRGARGRPWNPGLDASAGGEDLEDWAPLANGRRSRNLQPEVALYEALRPLAADYDLIVIDCPPGNRELQLLAMVAARHVVIPTKPDEASFDGLVRVAHLFEAVRPLNPGLRLLGVVLFGIETRATRIRHDAHAEVARELGDGALVFDSDIRHLLAPARDSRGRGQLAHEYEDAVLAAPRFYEAGGRDERLASSAPGLASDYQRLTVELLKRMQGSPVAVNA